MAYDRNTQRIDKIRKRLRKHDVVAVVVFRNGRMANVTHDNFEDMLARDGRVYSRILGGRDIICCDDEVSTL